MSSRFVQKKPYNPLIMPLEKKFIIIKNSQILEGGKCESEYHCAFRIDPVQSVWNNSLGNS